MKSIDFDGVFSGTRQTFTAVVASPNENYSGKKRSHNVVLFCHYPGQNNAILRRDRQRNLFYRAVEDAGFTVIAVPFPVQNPWCVEDRKNWYYYPESGSADVLWKAYQLWCQKEKQPVGRVFITGESGGANQAQSFAAAFPDRVVAAAFFGGGNGYDKPQKGKNTPLWFTGWNWTDVVAPGNYNLFASLNKDSLRCWGVETMPGWDAHRRADATDFKHPPTELSYELIIAFMAGVSDLMDANNGEVPAPATWQSKFNRTACLLDGDPALQNSVLPQLPEAMPSPSAEFTKLVLSRPMTLQRYKSGGHPLDWGRWSRPQDSAPKGILWYCPNDPTLTPSEREADVLFLASKGWAVFDIKAESLPPVKVRETILPQIPEDAVLKIPQAAVLINPKPDAWQLSSAEGIYSIFLMESARQLEQDQARCREYLQTKGRLPLFSCIVTAEEGDPPLEAHPFMNAKEQRRIEFVQPDKRNKRLALHHQFLEKVSEVFKTVRPLSELQNQLAN